MTAVKTPTADGGWHVAITEGTVSFNSSIWKGYVVYSLFLFFF